MKTAANQANLNKRLAKLVDMESQFALKVRSLVLGDSFLSSKAVEHRHNLNIRFLCLCFIGHFAEAAHSVAGCFCIIAIAEATALCLANALQS